MSEAKQYDKSYKEQAVKLAGQIGVKKASKELKVPYGTIYGWVQAAKKGKLDIERVHKGVLCTLLVAAPEAYRGYRNAAYACHSVERLCNGA